MTVKELKEKLEQFDDDLTVFIPCELPDMCECFPFTRAKNISQGVNEYDGAVFIDAYEEDE